MTLDRVGHLLLRRDLELGLSELTSDLLFGLMSFLSGVLGPGKLLAEAIEYVLRRLHVLLLLGALD